MCILCSCTVYVVMGANVGNAGTGRFVGLGDPISRFLGIVVERRMLQRPYLR